MSYYGSSGYQQGYPPSQPFQGVGPGGPPPEPTFCPQPPDIELTNRILKCAEFSFRNPQFESFIRTKEAANPEYSFLQGGPGAAFYYWVLQCLRRGVPWNQPPGTPANPYAAPPQPQHPPQHQHQHSYPQQQPQPPQHQAPQQYGGQAQAHHYPQQQQQQPPSAFQAPPPQPAASQQLMPGARVGNILAAPEVFPPAGYPPEVLGSFAQVLDALSGQRAQIQASQEWFMQCVSYAPGMAQQMAERARDPRVAPDAALHVVYLANDVLFKGLSSRQPGSTEESDTVALSFRPHLGLMLQGVWWRPGFESAQPQLRKLVSFWGEKGVYTLKTLADVDEVMTTQPGAVPPSLARPQQPPVNPYPTPAASLQPIGSRFGPPAAQPPPSSSWGPPPSQPPPHPQPTNGWGAPPSVASTAAAIAASVAGAFAAPHEPPPGPGPSSGGGWGPPPGMQGQPQPPQYQPQPPAGQPGAWGPPPGQPPQMGPPGGGAWGPPPVAPQGGRWAQPPQGGPQPPPGAPPPGAYQGYPPHPQDAYGSWPGQPGHMQPPPQPPAPKPPPEPVDSFQLPTGLIPGVVREKVKAYLPYTPLTDADIQEAMGMAETEEPAEPDACVKAKVARFFAECAAYRTGMEEIDVFRDAMLKGGPDPTAPNTKKGDGASDLAYFPKSKAERDRDREERRAAAHGHHGHNGGGGGGGAGLAGLGAAHAGLGSHQHHEEREKERQKEREERERLRVERAEKRREQAHGDVNDPYANFRRNLSKSYHGQHPAERK